MKVFITTAGVGSKLGDLTKYMNKAMIKIGKKPVISYIIEQYPNDYEFVIGLGYKGDHIKQFLQIAYPNRKFVFVTVDNYEHEGSSQIYSMWCCKDYLQEPFIYNDCDSICNNINSVLAFKEDWIGGTHYDNPYGTINYDSYDISYNYKITNMYHRATNPNAKYVYVGICGIYNYKYFWDSVKDALEHVEYSYKTDFDIFYNYYLNKTGNQLKHKDIINWTDTGTIDGVIKARKECKDKLDILDKNNQAIFIINNKVIKFFTDDETAKNISIRLQQLYPLSHTIDKLTKNFLSYDYIKGDVAINSINPVLFNKIMSDFDDHGLWDAILNVTDFKENQKKFYIAKTIKRINEFKKKYDVNEDDDIVINGVLIPKEYTIEKMLDIMQELDEYKNSEASSWHGDFTLENMIYDKETNKLTLIDCRDKFGDSIDYGDRLYDYGKINHNLTFNFASAIKGNYRLEINDHEVNFSIMCDLETYKCREVLKKFVSWQDIRYDYIELLSGLNWVNMSPLHPINDLPYLLFYMGKLQMYEAIMKLTNKS